MSLEASEVAVRVRLLGGTAFEKEAQGVAKSVEGIGAAGKKANAEGDLGLGTASAGQKITTLGNKVGSFGQTMSNLGRMLMPASVAIGALGYYAVKAQSQFQSSMMLLYTQAGLPRKNLQGLTNDVLNLAKAVGQTPDALAQGAFPIVSSGFHDPKKIMGLLKLAGVMAAVGHDTVDNTANALTSIINTGFNPKGGAQQIAAWLEATVGQGKMHLPDLTAALNSSILPMVKMTGMQLPQILAASAALTREGVDASSVMSRMRLSLTSVTSPTTMGVKALASMGLGKFALANDLRGPMGLLGMLQDLKQHADALGNKDLANNYIAQIFGKSRGIGNIGALLDALPQMTSIYKTVMKTTPRLLQQHFQGAKSTSAFKLQQIHAEYDQAMIKLGQAINKDLLPVLVKLIPVLTSVINWFGHLSPGIQKLLVIFGALTVVLSPILMVLGGLLGAFKLVLSVLGPVIDFLGTLVAGIGVASAALAILVAGVVIVAYIFRKQLWDAIKAVANFFVGVFWTSIHNVVKIATALWDVFKGLVSIAGKVLGFFGHLLGKVGKGILGAVESPFKSIGHFFGSIIPGLAGGGMVQSSGLAFVGERGPELLSLPRGATVTPLPGNGVSSLQAQFGENVGNLSVTVNQVLDGKVIATSVANFNRKQLNRK